MKAFLSLLKQHPVSIFFYLLYAAICGRMLWTQIQYMQSTNLNHGEKLMWGEGIMYGYLTIFMIAIIFSIIIIINAIVCRKEQTSFYLWLLVLVIIPPFILGYAAS